MINSKIVNPSPENIVTASRILHDGGIIVFPTETVYGLGADAHNDFAIQKIYNAKKRPLNNPLIVHVPSLENAMSISIFSELETFLGRTFWPGPLTLVLKKKSLLISTIATAGLSTIAIRVPRNSIAISLLKEFGKPVVAPSANKSGEISATLPSHALDLAKDVEMILDGKFCDIGLESTILKCENNNINILREGFITRDVIKKAIIQKFPKINISFQSSSKKVISPGQLTSHYSPKSNLRLNVLIPKKNELYLAFGPLPLHANGFSLSEKKHLPEAGRNLYKFLRLADELILSDTQPNKRSIAVAPIPNISLGISINDRLKRGATKKK